MTSTNRVVANALISLEELLKKQGLSRAEFDKMMKEMKDKGVSAVHYMRGKDGRLLFKADGTTIGNAISEKAVNGAEVENTRTLPVSKQAWTECELKGIEAMKKYLASHKGVLPRTIKEVDDVLGIIPDIDVTEKQNVMSYFKYGRGNSLVANSMKDDVAKVAKMVGRSLTPNEERSARILLEAGEPASRIARSIQAMASNAARNAKFKVGDKVKFVGPGVLVWGKIGSVGTVKFVDTKLFGEKDPLYDVEFPGSQGYTDAVAEECLRLANAARSTNSIVAKALNAATRNANFRGSAWDRALAVSVRPKFSKGNRVKVVGHPMEDGVRGIVEKTFPSGQVLITTGYDKDGHPYTVQVHQSYLVRNSVVQKALNAARARNAVGRDKQDAASVELWAGMFENNFLKFVLPKSTDKAKARKSGESIIKRVEEALGSEGGREQLKRMGWTVQRMRDALEKGLNAATARNAVAMNWNFKNSYQFFCVDPSLKAPCILSGWNYREDAKDDAAELKEVGIPHRIVSRRFLEQQGIDPNAGSSWKRNRQ